MFGDIIVLEGDALGTCARDGGILHDGEGWLCLFFSRSGNSGKNSVAAGLMCHGLAHCSSFVWDPGPVAGQCIHVCCDCLCVIALFRVVMLLVHDSTRIGFRILLCQTNTCDVGGLMTIYPSCDVIRLSHRDEWQIKGLVAVMIAVGYDVTRFPLCASKHATSVGVVPPGIMPILVIGLLGCGGSPLGRSDWLNRFSWEAWLAGGPMCVRSAVAFLPGGVRIMHIRSEPAGSSSINAAPVTGSLSSTLLCVALPYVVPLNCL